MKGFSPVIARYLLALLLVAGQWVYAEHNAESDLYHQHGSECAVCLYQLGTGASSKTPALTFYSNHFYIAESSSEQPVAALVLADSIRAPPAH